MRGDTSRMNVNDPVKESGQDAADTEMCGFNILKTARMINLIVGVALSVVCGLAIVNIFGDSGVFGNLGKFFLNVYLW